MRIAEQVTQLKQDFDDVKRAGYDEGYEKGKSEGGDSYYDTFWDIFQANGTRKNYGVTFATSGGNYGSGWIDETFDPKYGFEMTYCVGMFQYSNITELAGKLKRKELKFDTSQCNSLQQMFQGTSVLDIPAIDASISTNNGYFLGSYAKTVSVEKFISSEITAYGNTTFYAPYLKHIIFEGVIAQSITIGNSPLDKDSLTSLVNTLSSTTSGLTATVNLTAVNNAFEGGKDGTEWQTLITSKPNWDFAYA